MACIRGTVPLVAIAVAAAIVLCCAQPALALARAPEFVLELSKPPAQRWDGAVAAVVAAHGWENSFGGVWKVYGAAFEIVASLVPGIPAALEAHIAKAFPTHYEEITGIAAQFAAIGHPELNSTALSSLALFYEIAHTNELQGVLPPSFLRSCTGILSLPMDRTQSMIHGRNMDEQPAPGRNCTLSINVTLNGQLQYQMFDWMWVTSGVYTSSRIGGVTLEMNWRNDGKEGIVEVFQRILSATTIPSVFAFRMIQEQKLPFNKSVEFLMTTQFAAPFYVITSGTDRVGAVLTLYFNASQNWAVTLSDNSARTYLVQTNYDLNKKDDPNDPRRTVAEDALKMLGPARSGSELGVWMTLGTWPVHNKDTMFTVLMRTDAPLEGYVRQAIEPA